MENIVKKETEVFGGGTSEYEYNISALRILACIMVIGIHVSASYVVNFSNISNFEFAIGNLWNSFSRPAVPIFVMICGKYALDKENSNYINYYSRIFKKIYIPTILWSIFYMSLNYFCCNISIKKVIISTIGGSPFYHLWYLYMMIGVYLSVPFLIKLKNKIGEEKFRNLGIILLFISFIIVLFRDFTYLAKLGLLKYYWKINQFKFINYLGYFILGYSLRNLKIEIKKGIVYSLISGVVLFLTVQIFKTKFEIMYDYNYPWVVIYSIFLYTTFLQLKLKGNKILNLDKYTFKIYLIHAFILFIDIRYFNIIPVIIKIPLKIMVIFFSSLGIIFILNKIKKLLFYKIIIIIK